jgi:hypothetical protein
MVAIRHGDAGSESGAETASAPRSLHPSPRQASYGAALGIVDKSPPCAAGSVIWLPLGTGIVTSSRLSRRTAHLTCVDAVGVKGCRLHGTQESNDQTPSYPSAKEYARSCRTKMRKSLWSLGDSNP